MKWSDPRGLKIHICVRSAQGMPGNHRYIWDDRFGKEKPSCGMEQFFGHGDDPFKTERGPARNGAIGDTCYEVPGSDGFEDRVMGCCKERNEHSGWLPFFNDCYNVSKYCVNKYLPGADPGGASRFNTQCSTCWKPQPQDPSSGPNGQ